MRVRCVRVTFAALLLVPGRVASAQPSLPPVRPLSKPTLVAVVTFSPSTSFRPLADGRVIVNDIPNRSVMLFDTALVQTKVIYDNSTMGVAKYPAAGGEMFTGPGDSTYISDLPAGGFRVIGPDGRLVRRQTLLDIRAIISTAGGTVMGPENQLYTATTLVPRAPREFSAEPHDSLLLIRIHLDSRRRDTLGIIDMRTPTRSEVVDSIQRPGGGWMATKVHNMMPAFEIGDAMAINSFGQLAVIRATDFHVDWLNADGSWRHSPPTAWIWQHLSQAEKDSIAAIVKSSFVSGNGPVQMTMDAGPVPDVAPAFAPMSAVPDREGRIWVQVAPRASTRVARRRQYAALDSAGRIVDQILLPTDRTLAGFGPPGTIYVVWRDGHEATLERYSLKP